MSNPWSNQLVSLVIVAAPPGQYAGIFVYSPSPRLGTLIGSWAAQAGVDPYGNAYPQGLNVTTGSITGVTFNGTNFVINSSGMFFYSGTPAAGNLILSIANASGTDAFGNAYLSGTVTYAQVSGGNFSAYQAANGQWAFYGATSEAGPWTQKVSFFAGMAAGAIVAWNLTDTANNISLASTTTGSRGLLSLTAITGTAQPFMIAGDPVIGGNTLETWHDMRALSNSFVGTIASRYPPQYRRTAAGFVEIFGYVQFPAAGGPNFNGITFANLPAAYRSGSNTGARWPITLETNVAPVGTPCCQIDSTGNIQFHNVPASGMLSVIACISGRFPIDATGLILS